MWFDDQFENTFRRLSNRFFNYGDIFENPLGGQVQTIGPYYYGYEMTVGPDGKPHVKEWGNTKPVSTVGETGAREPFVDETIDEKGRILKLVTEMPGIEKSDIKVNIDDNVVSISAEHGDRKYSTKIPLKYKVDENSAKAKYTNGVLELTLSLAEEKPKGRLVSVE
ncbi:MAG: Hsp20/alpha crystallin family protein [Nitrosopumilus sp.]|nr:Hsp20/alpha crystallin family protein [Nitrosopumilus sp.]NNL58257.1 Hsp20/alpha crystallin family protein [Nitrosopumilus sp.]